MGSRSKNSLAYIAGFLDGDGSLMLQIKKRRDGALKRRFMCTIVFYQDTRHEAPLRWIRRILGIGYLSRRNDGMSELRINGFAQTRDILSDLLPFIRFKRVQAQALLKAATILASISQDKLIRPQLSRIADHIVVVQNANYATRRKKDKSEIRRLLGLTP
ncbi:MAG TPA: LAGLIDADG family homing endonuclease [Candidatus Paceibacterota bacterium]|nr:LAGLIDADG family homing endonuclease [Candidatus Paceibacterota bacterium]